MSNEWLPENESESTPREFWDETFDELTLFTWKETLSILPHTCALTGNRISSFVKVYKGRNFRDTKTKWISKEAYLFRKLKAEYNG